ncbi:MAG TPA: beta-xylosidase [Phycisphaerales bacterium]|nr:beta-xylosidase [Phycisphaerales bacterium]
MTPTHNYNAQHSPAGAFFSFTCGKFGSQGGIAAEKGGPGDQDIHIGYKVGKAADPGELMCLPFFKGATADEAARFDVEKDTQTQNPIRVRAIESEQIDRDYQLLSDNWHAGPMRFTIQTPCPSIPNPEHASTQQLRKALRPAVNAQLQFDNTDSSETVTMVFGMSFGPGAAQIHQGLAKRRVGFAIQQTMGLAFELADDNATLTAYQHFTVENGLAAKAQPVFGLGGAVGVYVEIPAGARTTLNITLATYNSGIATTGIESRYYYTRLFGSLTDVLNDALDHVDDPLTIDAAYQKAYDQLTAEKQWLIAHATHSYFGSTQLLDVAGKPYWIVNEGEYCMINTLDLSVDHLFFEMKFNPWLVRNVLDRFVEHYSYFDQVTLPGSDKLYPGGISFTHDQGVLNNFTPKGYSSYEVTEELGCFSYMTQEQLCNWSLMAATYVSQTDDQTWLDSQRHVIGACLESMLNRDHHDPPKRTGIMQFDSSRCGRTGQEITTYDSLDHSLAQARNNLYIAIKGWATYLGLAMMLQQLGDDRADEALLAAKRAARTVCEFVQDDGTLPAVFEEENPGYQSRILPAIEGLVYPMNWGQAGQQWLASDGPFAELLSVLQKHTQKLLIWGKNHYLDGGIRLSSTSGNSWLSKISIFQHVAQEFYGLDTSSSDAAHIGWITGSESSYFAMSDQFLDGIAKGSKYYPRIVTNWLWLDRWK